MSRYRSPHVGPIENRPKRDVSFPFAREVLPSGITKVVYAGDYGESRRPSQDTVFVCLSCGEKMHWVVGTKKANQPHVDEAELKKEVERSDPYFQHNPGGRAPHIRTETDSITTDLVQFLYKRAQRKGLNPTIEADSQGTRIIQLTYEADDEIKKLSLVISPRGTEKLKDDQNAIFITSTEGQGGDRRRLTLRDKEGHPLSAHQLKDFIAGAKVNDLLVSGFYLRDHRRQATRNGQITFVPRLIRLTEAISSVLKGDRVWVENVDAIPHSRFPSGARFALVNVKDLDAVNQLIERANPTIKRRKASDEIASVLEISVTRDAKYVSGTEKYRFGNGDILYVDKTLGETKSHMPEKGQHKVIVNPSGEVLLRNMEVQDWRNTLVLFVGDSKEVRKMRTDFFEKVSQRFSGSEREAMGMTIESASISRRAIERVRGFLGPDIATRNLLLQENPPPLQYEIPFGKAG